MKTLFGLTLLAFTFAPMYAQVVSPDVLVAPAPQPPARRDAMAPSTLRSADLQWLWQYAEPTPGGNKAALLADPRFAALLRDQLTTPQSFWGINRSLSDAATDFLAGEGTVTARDNRYFVVTGCVVDQCGQKGMFWIDLGATKPVAVFTAKRWAEANRTPDDKDAPFMYWVYPSRSFDAQKTPATLKSAFSQWDATKICTTDSTSEVAIIVNPDSEPQVTTSNQLGIETKLCTTAS